MLRFTPRLFHSFPEQEPPVPTEWKTDGPRSRSRYFRGEITFDSAGNRAWDHMSSSWNVLGILWKHSSSLLLSEGTNEFLFPENRYIPRKVVYLWHFLAMTSFFDGLLFRSSWECSHFKDESTFSLMQSILFNCLQTELDFSHTTRLTTPMYFNWLF